MTLDFLYRYVIHEKARKYMCVTDRHGMILAVKVALNPNTTNQKYIDLRRCKDITNKSTCDLFLW